MLEQLPSPNMSGPILVIDDEPYILRSLSYLLQREGYTVETAVNGAEGLQRVRSLRPPLVFLDIMMPHMDGVEVSRRLRDDPLTADIPIIAMSAQNRLASTAGLMPINDRLRKPFEVEDLYATIARWIPPA